MALYEQLALIKEKLEAIGRANPDTVSFLDARMKEAAALPSNMPHMSELTILRRLMGRRDVRDTEIEMDLLALMPDDEPEARSEIESTAVHSTPRSHSFYKHQKQVKR